MIVMSHVIHAKMPDQGRTLAMTALAILISTVRGGLAILTRFMRLAVVSFPSLSLKSPTETASVLACACFESD